MQRTSFRTLRHRRHFSPNSSASDRRGSTLIVVIGLLGLLALLGFFFYTFANQEQGNAEYFSGAAKEPVEVGLSADMLFNFALKQLILGADEHHPHSALWGGRHSLVPNMFGRDVHPYSGRGINVIDVGGGVPGVDQNYDGTPDQNELLNFNDSPAARVDGVPISYAAADYPHPDVDYTYPDINNVFLAYDGYTFDPGTGPPGTGAPVRVIIPSFHRPQYLRGVNADDRPRRVMHPHEEHVSLINREVGNPGGYRFVRDSDDWVSMGLSGPFPYFNIPSQGVWDNQPNYEFHADPDGDGIKEAVYLDLDFPVQELGDGRKFVPLFAFTVKEADSRFNLNAHGNLAGTVNLNGGMFGNGDFLSQSNQGLFRSEVNPIYGLNAHPSADLPSGDTPANVFSQHESFFGHIPNNSDWGEAGNMEYYFSLVGRLQFDSDQNITDGYPGRWGDIDRLLAGFQSRNPFEMPQPGAFGFDDNNNRNWGIREQPYPMFVHPLDFHGSGTMYDSNGKTLLSYVAPDGLNRWLRYTNFTTWSDGPYAFLWGLVQGNQLMQIASLTNPLIDEPAETEVDPRLANPDDQIFQARENTFLNMSSTDLERTGQSSRLGSLMEWNLRRNTRASDIRKRFATTSWDLKNFAMPWYGAPDAPDVDPSMRPWEFTVAQQTNGFGEARYVFPPRRVGTNSVGETIFFDPFRPELRRLLQQVAQQTDAAPHVEVQRLLSLNHVVTFQNENPGAPLQFRRLTPHVIDGSLGADSVSQQFQGSRPAYPPQNPMMREWWARYDRQRMARDIYTLLYVFGCGEDVNPLEVPNIVDPDTGTGTLYNEAQLRAMAQFAVNVVDAMDPDSVITMFEYDKNLANGWNLNDDPFDDQGLPETVRGVVYGVETQQLTISEALVIRAPEIPAEEGDEPNHPATQYDDGRDNIFTYIELRNASPIQASLDSESWQIQVVPQGGLNTARERRLTLRQGTISGGGLFTIGTVSNGELRDDPTAPGQIRAPSHFKVDPNWESGQTPDFAALPALAPASQNLDLDLVPTQVATADLSTETRFIINQPPGANQVGDGQQVLEIGGLLNEQTIDAGTTGVTFILRRRLNPARVPPDVNNGANGAQHEEQSRDNPWVEVDRFDIDGQGALLPIRQFELQSNEEENSIYQPKLAVLTSRERIQPLSRTTGSGTAAAGNPFAMNSLGMRNQTSVNQMPNGFELWQPHFDRDFASEIELLSVPLYGPRDVTRFLRLDGAPVSGQGGTAGVERFLNPLRPQNPVSGTAGNRWYRLLAFAEVPDRMTSPDRYRTPGKINLNMVQYPEILAGLVDDRTAIGGFSELRPATGNPNGYLRDAFEGTNRDWWIQFLRARDRRDPQPPHMYLPGLPGSRPFRTLANVAHGHPDLEQRLRHSLEHTLLRSLPLDLDNGANTITARRLFQIGTQGEHNNGSVDYHTRNRILSKIVNNVTNRSNVFLVFIQVDFFEAVEVDGAVRIGAKLDDSPGHRGFFVVDRSLAFEHLKMQDFREPTSLTPFTIQDTFNYHSVILHRTIIE